MKKERAIIIKNPHLRKVRNQLRVLLKLWIADIRSSLRDQKFAYFKDNDIRFAETHKKLSSLRLLEIRSICSCLFCDRSDRNMIYVPDMKQWLCIDCHSEQVHHEQLRDELQMSREEIKEFLDRLAGEEGISLTRFGSSCNGYTCSKRILKKMGITKETQDKFFQLCYYYGGHCDCEILFNASERLLEYNK